jgi:phosphopantothenoylcysteine decarboxylase/phosphopantothenate--cysteine ligase
MATLTIRKLDDAVRDALRLRAAKSGRSVEDEVRVILRDHTNAPTADVAPSQAPPAQPSTRERQARMPTGTTRRALLVIGGGIAAYKSLDLIRRLKERGFHVRCVMTRAAQQFVTPLAAGALADERCYTDLFDPASEFDAGHIRLARDCDLVIVAPATADLIAKMANGHADDLASAILLATNRPVLIAPAMNPLMWSNAATQRNVARLKKDNIVTIGPNAGEMAESGEAGTGRMAEPLEIASAAETLLRPAKGPLSGKRIVVTAGPTHEAIDPVRYIANRSSGKQGYAIAEAAAEAGAEVILISGPVDLPDPPNVQVLRVESARDMLARTEAALPADVAIFAAAVADWRVAQATDQKIKKTTSGSPQLKLVENPDILATIAGRSAKRPQLVIGFAAETQNLIENAKGKLARKKSDWIVANDVSPQGGVMGGDFNTVHIVSRNGVESWPPMSKTEVAATLMLRVAAALKGELE